MRSDSSCKKWTASILIVLIIGILDYRVRKNAIRRAWLRFALPWAGVLGLIVVYAILRHFE